MKEWHTDKNDSVPCSAILSLDSPSREAHFPVNKAVTTHPRERWCRATHTSVCQCCVTKAVAEQQGWEQDLCPQTQVELMAQNTAKDCCGAQTGRRMYAGRSHEKIFFQRPPRSWESVARQEAMKSGEELARSKQFERPSFPEILYPTETKVRLCPSRVIGPTAVVQEKQTAVTHLPPITMSPKLSNEKKEMQIIRCLVSNESASKVLCCQGYIPWDCVGLGAGGNLNISALHSHLKLTPSHHGCTSRQGCPCGTWPGALPASASTVISNTYCMAKSHAEMLPNWLMSPLVVGSGASCVPPQSSRHVGEQHTPHPEAAKLELCSGCCWHHPRVLSPGLPPTAVQIKRNPFTAYITHLSIADISLLFCTFILSIEYIAGFGFAYGFYYYVTTTLSIVFLLGYNTGLYLLTAISIERCLSIVYPIWYRCHRSQHQSAIVCAILWTLSFFMTVAEYITCKDDSTKEQFDDGNHCQALLIFTWILTFMIFIPLMILSSLILVIRIHRNSLRPHSSKLYIIIVVTVIVFLIFAMPMRLLYLLNYHHWSSLLSQQNHVTIVLSTVNSSINPLVYFFVGSSKKKRFKESLKVVLSRALTDGLRPRSQEGRDVQCCWNDTSAELHPIVDGSAGQGKCIGIYSTQLAALVLNFSRGKRKVPLPLLELVVVFVQICNEPSQSDFTAYFK
ncbi:hypothetical protein IHE44_0009379 [Lamprotornis superbus]|uniref:G-protein coupled receptors family 1 profile domain-containing protein n=1 Tax=Lamprotornis superbus TaxID=245042 RepID=A0A835P319_9PASS|nr:hypothetical protein IHE44_0009379 [Lamprotornis superbus]